MNAAAAAASWKTWVGRTVDGKFALLQLLGGSDHSVVFLTERQVPPQRAVIKLVATDAADQDRQLSRWRAAARLSHPHLIRIFETGKCQLGSTPLLYIVMEYAEEDLSQILPQRALTPAEVSDLLPPLLDAVAFLHGKGLVHGRVKPSNVLAVGDLLLLSSDHIAPADEGRFEQRRRDFYDAPETASGVVSCAGDMWSVGATVVATLLQRSPFAEDASQKDPDLPPAIAEPFRGIARECLRFDPKRRSSLGEVRARLQPAGRSVPAEAQPVPKPPAPARRYRFTWRMLIPIAVLLAFVLGVRLLRRSSPPKASGHDERTAVAAVPAPAKSPSPTRTSKGEVVRQVLPAVPQSAKNTIWGTIKIAVRVQVDPSGKVTGEKLTSGGPSPYFAKRALQAAQHWQFAPPEVGGQPIASAWVVRFRLRRSSFLASAEQLRR
jgi:TonB family protein